MTDYHGYETPKKGKTDWHVPLNDNFRQIDRDIEIRGLEAERNEYQPKEAAKYLAIDTGRAFIGDGNNWRPVSPVGGGESPNVVCSERGDTPIAAAPDRTFRGSCVFDAAQQAIDAKIATEGGNVDLLIQPGEYDLTQGISIDDGGVSRVRISAPGLSQVKLNTGGIDSTDYGSAIAVDPGPLGSDQASGRTQCVSIEGLYLSDYGRSGRDINGIYVNDSNNIVIDNCRVWDGFKRGLWVRNCWQGVVNNLEVTRCGSDAAGTPGIQVGHHEDTQTYQAINHIQFNHLQGQVDQYAYLESRGTATRLDINFPNVEFLNLPGFVFDSTNGRMRGQVRGSQLTGGEPAIELIDGARVQIVGGYIGADGAAIKANGNGVPKLVVGGGIELAGGDGHNVVDVEGGWLNLSGFHVWGGKRGILVESCGMVNIGNGTVVDSRRSGIMGRHLNRNSYTISDINLINVSNDGENPIHLTNVDNLCMTGISANTPSPVPVVSLDSCNNTRMAHIVPAGSSTDEIEDVGSNTFRSNKGTATVSSGSRSVSVDHGLAHAPAPEDIAIIPADTLAGASSWYVAGIGVESFDINVDKAPSEDVLFGWKVSLG